MAPSQTGLLLLAVGADGIGLMVTVTVADESAQGGFEIVQRTTTGPAPPVCVKVAFGVEAFGLKVPVPPETTDQLPVPEEGALPPRPVVVVKGQIAWAPPTVAVDGGEVTDWSHDAEALVQLPTIPTTE